MGKKRKRSQPKKAVSASAKTRKKTDESIREPVRSHLWWRSCLIIMAVALFIRLFYLAEIHDEPDFTTPWIDAAYHDVWARGIAFDEWRPPEGMNDPEIQSRPYFRPPGYSFFLAGIYKLTGGSYLAPRIFQIGLGILSTLLIMGLARNIFGNLAGQIAGVLFAFSWAAIYFEGQLMAPSLLIALGCTLLIILSKWTQQITWQNGVCAGMVFAVFALVRPNILLFGPIILIWGFWLAYRRQVWAPMIQGTLGFCIAAGLMIAPTTIRNYRVSGELVLITCNAGINLHIGNNPHTDGMSAVFPELSQLTGLKGWTSFDYPKIVQGVSRELGSPQTDSEISTYFTQKALAYMRHNPGKVIGLMAKKAALFWGPAEISNNKELRIEKESSWILRFLPGFPWIFASSLLGVILFFISATKKSVWDSGKFESFVLVFSFILVYFLSYLPFFVIGRFRVPLIPFLLMFSGYAAAEIWVWIRQKNLMVVIRWLLVWAVLVALAHVSVVPPQGDRGLWHYHKGIALQTQGKIEAAIQEFQKAVDVRQSFGDAWEKLGNGYFQQGHTRKAVDAWSRVLDTKSDVEVLNNLAWVHATSTDSQLRNPGKALDLATRACDLTQHRDPGKLDTLAVALAANHRFDEAITLTRKAITLAAAQDNRQLLEELRENLKRFESGLTIDQ